MATSITVSNGAFGDEVRKLSFNSEDLDNLNKATLFFSVRTGEDRLIIKLNNFEIFNEKVEGLQSINLPLDLLRDANVLEFEVSGPGINIFDVNEYSLRDIKVRQSFELTNTGEKRNFVLSAAEKGNAILNYAIFCNSAGKNNRLIISVNNKEITNEVIACRTASRSIDINSRDLLEGDNEIFFQIDEGDYLLNDIKIEVKSEEGGTLEYKFSINDNEFEDITADLKSVVLNMEFSDEESHNALLSVNGDEFTLDIEDDTYSKDITRFVKKGNNNIKITPQNEFDLGLLEIKLR